MAVGSAGDITSYVGKLVPPTFTVPMLMLKAFIPSLPAVFALGMLLALAMFFHPTKENQEKEAAWYRQALAKVVTVITCFAWLLIFNESAANYLANKFVFGNSVDDHTYLIRVIAGGILVLRIVLFGFEPERDAASRPQKQKKDKRVHATEAKHAPG